MKAFYAGFRSEHSRCDSTSSLLSGFFSSSLQTHPCFLTSIFPETEEAPGWRPGAHLYHRFYERHKRLWCPLAVGRGIGRSPASGYGVQSGGHRHRCGSLFLKAFFFGLEGGAVQGPRGRGRNLWVWRRSVHRCQTACPSIRPFNQVFSADNGRQRRRLDGS